jgi:alkylated DNA repair dioxygenase AlkB
MANLIDRIFERITTLEKSENDHTERISKLNALLVKKGVVRLSPRSWVLFKPQAIECSQEQFDEFWDLCPTEHHEIMMFGKKVPIPRFQKLYGEASYKFSGVEMEADPEIPDLVQRCIDFARENWAELPNGTPLKWNGALCNWYPDGSSYIGAHSDDEKDLMPGVPILSFSFGGVRTFRVKCKLKKPIDGTVLKQDFETLDCSLLAMGGLMQQEYKHEITKTKKIVAPRINITVRCFS